MTTDPQHRPGAAPAPSQAMGAEAPTRPDELPPASQPPPAPVTSQAPQHAIKHTRTRGVWVAVAFFAVILLLLLIFILQNGMEVKVSYMGAHGRLPLGVAMLLSAVCGALLAILAGAARISRNRAVVRRHRRADARRAGAEARR